MILSEVKHDAMLAFHPNGLARDRTLIDRFNRCTCRESPESFASIRQALEWESTLEMEYDVTDLHWQAIDFGIC